MLKLYHGSNVVIDKIDLCRSRKGKDFGEGTEKPLKFFYV